MKDNCNSLSHMECYDLIVRTFMRMRKSHIPKKTIVMQIGNRYIMAQMFLLVLIFTLEMRGLVCPSHYIP